MVAIRDLRSQAVVRRGDELAAFLKDFTLEPRFSVGVWFFNPADNRFHERYQPVASIEERLERIASLAPLGVVGVEAHFQRDQRGEPGSLEALHPPGERHPDGHGGALLFRDADFEFGALSSPIPRRAARPSTAPSAPSN